MLKVTNLKKYFGKTKAVDGVTFDLCEKETLGIVGESGCGKTTLARTIMRLYDSDGGEILLYDQNKISKKDLYNSIQMVFQNPFQSLDERHTIESLMYEGMYLLGKLKKQEKKEYAKELLNMVGLSEDYLTRFPHQLSGGQRQRVCIARAIASKPKILILDEPTSALDAKIAAQILKLLKKLQENLDLSYIFISHDLKLIKKISDRVLVMYNGKIVEEGNIKKIWEFPTHQYTKTLISACLHKLK